MQPSYITPGIYPKNFIPYYKDTLTLFSCPMLIYCEWLENRANLDVHQ